MSCNITSPTIVRSGYEAVGWNTNNTANVNAWSGWSISTQEVEKAFTTTGETWYAITYKNNTSGYLKDLILAHNNVKTGADFTVVANTEAQTGLFSAPDDYGTSYYFRGGVTNNNVIFAGYQWKIIRIDGNDNVRLIYNGLCPVNSCSINPSNSADLLIGSSTFNNGSNSTVEVSYVKRADSTDSIIKTFIDGWYNANFSTSARNKVTNVIYCNDITISDYVTNDEWVPYYYAGRVRLKDRMPSLNCSVSNRLDLTIGLITADEIAMAGSLYGTSSTAPYLGSSPKFWTLTASFVEKVSNCGTIQGLPFVFSGNGFGSVFPDSESGVRPVLALSASTLAAGDGSSLNPYVVQ